MESLIQGNKPLRYLAGMVLLILTLAHFLNTIDLTQPSVLWILVMMGINAFQASFTGFCPMFKNKKGECIACGVQCSSESSKEKS
jgi:hypothetical protein